MRVTQVRFITTPQTCIHGAFWDYICEECQTMQEQLAIQGISVIPRNVMAVGVLVDVSASKAFPETAQEQKRLRA